MDGPGPPAETSPEPEAAAEPARGPETEGAAEPVLGPVPEAVDTRPARAPAGELTTALCALTLFVTLFAAKWYGVVALPRSADRSGLQTAASAWDELALLRWLMLLCVLVTLGSVAIHVSQRSHGSQTDTSLGVAAVGTLTAGLLFVRVLVVLPAPGSVLDAKLGAYVGLLAAVGIALGGVESVLDQRRHRRRRQARSHRRIGLATDLPAR